ncbi:hypothetical protein AMTR_s00048p00232430 [Amborella trichopoda]|uniref:Uncharacterized protein n=1 Tax=Amborella trichopoda TaxID=13333 RepID=U5D5T5_AMBTC|nr:hypothetical protein AMTR_s00048p00232430 [Amborella trichopoda]
MRKKPGGNRENHGEEVVVVEEKVEKPWGRCHGGEGESCEHVEEADSPEEEAISLKEEAVSVRKIEEWG